MKQESKDLTNKRAFIDGTKFQRKAEEVEIDSTDGWYVTSFK